MRDHGEIPTARVPIAVGVLAAFGVGLLVVPLGSLEWYDAAIAVFSSTLDRGRHDAACRRPGRLAGIVKHVRPIRST